MTDRLLALLGRLYAAAGFFWLAGAALVSVWRLHIMAMCVFFALALIPLKLCVDLIKLTVSSTAARV